VLCNRRAYFDDIATFRLPGCFAMTELKHGSNVSLSRVQGLLLLF
jgi:acyl-CoA oxidase